MGKQFRQRAPAYHERFEARDGNASILVVPSRFNQLLDDLGDGYGTLFSLARKLGSRRPALWLENFPKIAEKKKALLNTA